MAGFFTGWTVRKYEASADRSESGSHAISVGRVASDDGEFAVGGGGPGQLTSKLRSQLVAIQRGTAEDKHGWVHRLD